MRMTRNPTTTYHGPTHGTVSEIIQNNKNNMSTTAQLK